MFELTHNILGNVQGFSTLLRFLVSLLEFQIPSFSAQLVNGEYTGAVSELVTATLQTKGMFDQARILDSFNSELKGLAALFYLVAISGAVASMSIYGNYRRGMYLLIGPVLFYFMINNRIDANGTKLRIGEDEIETSAQDQRSFLAFIGQESNSDVGGGFHRVSWLFGMFDGVVSAVTQDIVSVILDTENREHTRRVARERALSWVLQQDADNPGFVRLISAGIFGECAEVIQGWMALGNRYQSVIRNQGRPANQLTAAEQAEREAYQRELQRTERRWNGEDGEGRRAQVPLDNQLRIYLARYLGGEPSDYPENGSCKQAWDWMTDIAQQIAEKKLDKADYLSARVESDRDTDWDRVFRDVNEALRGGPNGTANPVSVLAAYVLRNTLGQNTHWAMTQQVFGRAPFSQQKFNGMFTKMYGAEAKGGFMKLMYFAGTVKYIQGILLYLLSIAFPFFAILLILPGRASAFVVWGSLWVWVKSWDIGYALVHVARDLMWQFVVQGINRDELDVRLGAPDQVFSLIYANDPLATENTYWLIVSALTLSIPLLTAHCCLGATNLYDAFKNSIDQVANRFGQQHTASGRRDVNTAAEIRINQRLAQIEQEAIEKNMKEPMLDANGRQMVAGSYELQQRAYLHGQLANAEARWRPEMRADIALLGHSRRITYGAHVSWEKEISARTALRVNELYRNRSAAGGVVTPLGAFGMEDSSTRNAGVPFAPLTPVGSGGNFSAD